MIRSFRHRGLRRLFEIDDTSGILADFSATFVRQLTVLHNCAGPDGMSLPGHRLHPLKGGRKGSGPFGFLAIGGSCLRSRVRTSWMLILWITIDV
jgi:hypothetical protein